MTLAIEIDTLVPTVEDRRQSSLHVMLARRADDVEAAQRLRYRVFVEEMGARADSARPGIESDRFDPFCRHLIVRDRACNRVVGCYRILTDEGARDAGGFYSQTEFDITRILALPGRLMEVGRTCVHPDYRNGTTLALLWRGLTRFMFARGFDSLIGCASIPLAGGTDHALAVYETLAKHHTSPEGCRVYPKMRLPRASGAPPANADAPPLLRAYLRAGARICGEPAWDPFFGVADLFLLLRLQDIRGRYARHFLAHA
ncbi:MAG: GNAT family N-acetyltransferase [Gammaproteobacteria bacterium]